jgi:hypothetical protein
MGFLLPIILMRPKLPSTDRLLFYRSPNSEAHPWEGGEEEEWPEPWGEHWPWGSWVLPGSLFAEFGEGLFFDAVGTPLDVTGAEILTWVDGPGLPIVLFSTSKGLAIYADDTETATLNRARKYFGLAPLP